MEGRDCPISLEPFEPYDDVIQLRCNKFHVYREEWLNQMLQFTEIERKCLICRACILDHDFITEEDQLSKKNKWVSITVS